MKRYIFFIAFSINSLMLLAQTPKDSTLSSTILRINFFQPSIDFETGVTKKISMIGSIGVRPLLFKGQEFHAGFYPQASLQMKLYFKNVIPEYDLPSLYISWGYEYAMKNYSVVSPANDLLVNIHRGVLNVGYQKPFGHLWYVNFDIGTGFDIKNSLFQPMLNLKIGKTVKLF